MKKIKINIAALAIRDASRNFGGQEPLIIKLSLAEAMDFAGNFSSFEEMKQKYGADRLLKKEEEYKGYAAVYYNEYRQDVVFMEGFLKKLPSGYGDGNEYAILRHGKEATLSGVFLYVWTFRGCTFAQWAEELKKVNRLPQSTTSHLLDATLKDKLVNALLGNYALELTDEEFTVLKSYLGEYYRRFSLE